jgi:hypothetical protein
MPTGPQDSDVTLANEASPIGGNDSALSHATKNQNLSQDGMSGRNQDCQARGSDVKKVIDREAVRHFMFVQPNV